MDAAFGDAVAFLTSFFPHEAPWPLIAIKPKPRGKPTLLDSVSDPPSIVRAYTMRAWAKDAEPEAVRVQKRAATASAWIADQNRQGFNLYYQPNPHKKILQRKARKDDIAAVAYFFADLDPPKDATPDELAAWRTDVLQKLSGPLPGGLPLPTWIIDSGRGFWLLWQLREPLPLDGDGPLTAEAEARGIGIEQALVEWGADACHNIDRIARLPCTVNHKTGRTGYVVAHHPEALYSLEDFPKADVASRAVEPPAAVPLPNGPIPECQAELPADLQVLIRAGVPDTADRSAVFHSVVGQLRDRGWSVQQIVELLGEHPGGIAAKYRKRIVREVRRSFGKTDNSGAGHDERGSESFEFEPVADTASAQSQNGSTADGGSPPPGHPSPNSRQQWPDPKPITARLPPVAPFAREMLPPELADYVADIADRQQAPPDFPAVTSICGCGAMLGNRVRIWPKQKDDWEVVANPWGALIGRPSSMKSPAMRAALMPLYATQQQMRELWQAGLTAKIVDDALSTLSLKDKKKEAGKLLRGNQPEEARRLLEDLANNRQKTPCPRLIVNDATVPKLGELLNENPRGLLQVRDELYGFLSRMEEEQFQHERPFYLECYNGYGPYAFDRIERGTVHIECCTLGLIGGIQPTRIASLVRSAVDGSNNDGLVQRLQLAVWPDDPGQWKWVDRAPDERARHTYEETFQRLHEVGQEHLSLRFGKAAQEVFREWDENLNAKARSDTLSSVVESHILKLPKTIASLALIFQMIEDSSANSVGEMATLRAVRWSDYLLGHANRLYAAADVMAENGAKLIIERRAQLPSRFTVRDVQRKGWAGLAGHDLVEAAIEALIATHHCRATRVLTGVRGGRPTEEFHWNPKL
jgi:hypothetical protein